MKARLLSQEDWSKVLKEVESVTEILGVDIETSFYLLAVRPLEEYLPNKFGIDRQFLSTILPREPSILHTDLKGTNVGGWFTIINGEMAIQI